MVWSRLIALLLGFATTRLSAGPVEEAIIAAVRLSDQSSYAWTATVSDDARTYDITGRTVRGGFTSVTMPAINSVRRRLGRSVTDTQIAFIFRGNVDCVVETERGWKTIGELPSLPEELPEADPHTGHGGTLGLPGARTLDSRMLKGILLQPRRPPGRGDDRSLRGYSNLQLGVSHPHEELGVMVSCHVSLAAEEAGVLFGTLSESGAQLLLVRDGQKEIVPLAASGNFRLWVRDGMVQKYRVHLEGLLQVDTTAGRQTVRVNQTTETVIRDVGRAEFAVPEEARRKLGG